MKVLIISIACRLLKRNPDERILLDDALSHPWLKQNLLNSSKSLIEAKLESLQNFATMPELSRLLLLLYANKLGKDQGDSDACFGLFNWMVRPHIYSHDLSLRIPLQTGLKMT